MSIQPRAINSRISQRVARDIGQRRYDLWIEPSVRLDYEEHNQTLRVAVPNRFVAEKVRTDFSEPLRRAARAEAGVGDDQELRLDLCIAPDRFGPAAAGEADESRPTGPDAGDKRPPRRPGADDAPRVAPTPGARRPGGRRAPDPALAGPLRHRFEDFVVGPANELAYAAALSLAQRGGGGDSGADEPAAAAAALLPDGPLFVHGACGVDKPVSYTHLTLPTIYSV